MGQQDLTPRYVTPESVFCTNTKSLQVSIGSTSRSEVVDVSMSTDRAAQIQRVHRAGMCLHPLPEGTLEGTIRNKWQGNSNCIHEYSLFYALVFCFLYNSHEDGSVGKGSAKPDALGFHNRKLGFHLWDPQGERKNQAPKTVL